MVGDELSANFTGRLRFNPTDFISHSVEGLLTTIFTVVDVWLLFLIFFFLAFVKDRRVNAERIPMFLPVRPPVGFRMYALLLETGQSPAGGTTSNIVVRICGRLTKTSSFTLTCSTEHCRKSKRNLFDSKNKDLFLVSVPHYLGDIEAFEVYTDRGGSCPPWFLKSIRCMCLGNKKCWKSDIGAWLRGDKKPYHLSATMIGALSTKDYMWKVFKQNHNWFFIWSRNLGSNFKCKQRWCIFWTSISLGMVFCHFLLYDIDLVLNVALKKLIAPSFTGNEMMLAAFTSAAVGVGVGLVLRMTVKLTGSVFGFERVDDKDDFSHLLNCKKLVYCKGAVVKLPCKQKADICTAPPLDLTPTQMRAIKHIVGCENPYCDLRSQFLESGKTSFECSAKHPEKLKAIFEKLKNAESKSVEFVEPEENFKISQVFSTETTKANDTYLSNDTKTSGIDKKNNETINDISPLETDLTSKTSELNVTEAEYKSFLDKLTSMINTSSTDNDDFVPNAKTTNESGSCGSPTSATTSIPATSKGLSTSCRASTSLKLSKEDLVKINKSLEHLSDQSHSTKKVSVMFEANRERVCKDAEPHIQVLWQSSDTFSDKKLQKLGSRVEHLLMDDQAYTGSTYKIPTNKSFSSVPNCSARAISASENEEEDIIDNRNKEKYFPESSAGKKLFYSSKKECHKNCKQNYILKAPGTMKKTTRGTPVQNRYYDSMSDNESDVEIATRSARTLSEIKLSQRCDKIYKSAPLWCDKWRIWVQNPNDAKYHLERVNERYHITNDLSETNIVGSYEERFSELIKKYAEHEKSARLGYVKYPSSIIPNIFSYTSALLGSGALGFCAFQRSFLPNTDALTFFYATCLIIFFHCFVFSTLDALFWTFLSSCIRRHRMLRRRKQNAKKIRKFEKMVEPPCQENCYCHLGKDWKQEHKGEPFSQTCKHLENRCNPVKKC